MSAPPAATEKPPARRNACPAGRKCPIFVCCDASSRTQSNSVVFDGGTEESVGTLQPELVHPATNRCPSDYSGDMVAAEGAKVERPTSPPPPPEDQLAPEQPDPPVAAEQSVSTVLAEHTEETAVLEDTPTIETVPPDVVLPVPEGPEADVGTDAGMATEDDGRPALVDSCLEVLFARPGGGRPSRVLFRRRPLGLDFVPGVMPLEVVGASGAARALGVQQGWWVERFGGAEFKASFGEAEEAVRLLTQELPEREEATGGGCTTQ